MKKEHFFEKSMEAYPPDLRVRKDFLNNMQNIQYEGKD